MESTSGNVDFGVYENIINGALTWYKDGSVTLENPLLSYPTKASMLRAYIFSVISAKDNTNYISDQDFLAGCTRFAIENPVPTVSVRCALYGNTREVMTILDEVDKKDFT